MALDGTREINALTGSTIPQQDCRELDATGLQCPLPLLKAKRALSELASGECLRVFATDRGSVRDFKVYADHSGHSLLSSDEEDGVFIYVLQKQ